MGVGDEDRVKEGPPIPGQERPEDSSPEAKRQRQMIEEVCYVFKIYK